MLKIERKTPEKKPEVAFSALKDGQVFEYNRNLFMKIGEHLGRNAIWISKDTGFPCFFFKDDVVKPMDATLVVQEPA